METVFNEHEIAMLDDQHHATISSDKPFIVANTTASSLEEIRN